MRVATCRQCFSLVGDRWQDTVAAGQALDGEIIRAMQAMARRAEMWLSLGGFPEKTTLDGVDKVFNTHVIIDDLGSVQAVYRKIHLFDVVSTSMSPTCTSEASPPLVASKRPLPD